MKNLLLYCCITLATLSTEVQSAAVADSAVISPLSPLDLSAMPLVSRSLAEFSADSSESVEAIASAAESHASYKYGEDPSGIGWLFTSLSEPFYLSLLGAFLLLLGTIRRRDH